MFCFLFLSLVDCLALSTTLEVWRGQEGIVCTGRWYFVGKEAIEGVDLRDKAELLHIVGESLGDRLEMLNFHKLVYIVARG